MLYNNFNCSTKSKSHISNMTCYTYITTCYIILDLWLYSRQIWNNWCSSATYKRLPTDTWCNIYWFCKFCLSPDMHVINCTLNGTVSLERGCPANILMVGDITVKWIMKHNTLSVILCVRNNYYNIAFRYLLAQSIKDSWYQHKC